MQVSQICELVITLTLFSINMFTVLWCFEHSDIAKRRFVFTVLFFFLFPILIRYISAQIPIIRDYTIYVAMFSSTIPFAIATKGPLAGRLYMFFSLPVITNFFPVFGNFLAELLTVYGSTSYYIILTSFTLLMDTFFILLVWKYGRKVCDLLFSGTENYVWYIYALFPVATFFILKAFYYQPSSILPVRLEENLQLLALVFTLLAAFVFLPFGIINSRSKTIAEFELQFARNVLSSGREYYSKLIELSERLHILRHDSKYHVATLRKLAKSGDTAEVMRYLDILDAEYNGTAIPEYCKRPVLNALLDSFNERCGDEKICFTVQASVPDCLKADDYDLCIIIGNLLENAITACKAMPETERYITVTMKPNGNQFGIVVKNSFDGRVLQKDGEIISSKPDVSGLGITSINSVAKRFGGQYYPQWDSHEFSAYVVIMAE